MVFEWTRFGLSTSIVCRKKGANCKPGLPRELVGWGGGGAGGAEQGRGWGGTQSAGGGTGDGGVGGGGGEEQSLRLVGKRLRQLILS